MIESTENLCAVPMDVSRNSMPTVSPSCDGKTFPRMLYWRSGLPEASEAWNPMDPSKSLNRPSPVGIPSFADREDVGLVAEHLPHGGRHVRSLPRIVAWPRCRTAVTGTEGGQYTPPGGN